jgi:hypothetical protein
MRIYASTPTQACSHAHTKTEGDTYRHNVSAIRVKKRRRKKKKEKKKGAVNKKDRAAKPAAGSRQQAAGKQKQAGLGEQHEKPPEEPKKPQQAAGTGQIGNHGIRHPVRSWGRVSGKFCWLFGMDVYAMQTYNNK